MKKFLIEYINILGYVITGLIFGLSCFMLFLNFYHSKEVANTYVKSEEFVDVYTKNQSKLEAIKSNTSGFNANDFRGNPDQATLMGIKSNIDMCVSKYESSNINKIFKKEKINIQDVYDLVDNYQTDIINDCITLHIYSLNTTNDTLSTKSLDAIKPFIEVNSKMLINDLDYLKRNIQNNSSYQFSSDYDKINIFNLTRDSYSKVETSYQSSIDLVYAVSEWFKKVIGGEL